MFDIGDHKSLSIKGSFLAYPADASLVRWTVRMRTWKYFWSRQP